MTRPRLAALAVGLAASALAATTAPSTQASSPDLRTALGRALAAPDIDPGRTAAVAIELGTGKVVFRSNVGLALAPASAEKLAVSESLLFRRGNFNGSFDEIILEALLKHYDAQVAFSPGFRWGASVLPEQAITLEDVYTHTALTYPNTWSREMTGAEIKTIMEDVADNIFHKDAYYRQGGDMVRVGGVGYTIDPNKDGGQRITDLRIGGAPMDPARRYKATGWASMMEVDGPPVFDVVANYLRAQKRVRVDTRSRVKVV